MLFFFWVQPACFGLNQLTKLSSFIRQVWKKNNFANEKEKKNNNKKAKQKKGPLTWRNPPCSRRFLPGRNICPPAESDSRRTWGTWSASVCPAPSGWTCPGCADYSRHTEGSLRGETRAKGHTQVSAQREKERVKATRKRPFMLAVKWEVAYSEAQLSVQTWEAHYLIGWLDFIMNIIILAHIHYSLSCWNALYQCLNITLISSS